MRCPSCNKFATNDTSQEPEVTIDGNNQDAETGELEVTGNVRIVITSECCGDELADCTFDVSEVFDEDEIREAIRTAIRNLADNGVTPLTLVPADALHVRLKEIDWDEAELDCGEVTQDTESVKLTVRKDGTVKETRVNPRYARTYYGAEGQISIVGRVNVDAILDGSTKTVEVHLTRDWSDKVQASGMEPLN
jgi:hypothetical protein